MEHLTRCFFFSFLRLSPLWQFHYSSTTSPVSEQRNKKEIKYPSVNWLLFNSLETVWWSLNIVVKMRIEYHLWLTELFLYSKASQHMIKVWLYWIIIKFLHYMRFYQFLKTLVVSNYLNITIIFWHWKLSLHDSNLNLLKIKPKKKKIISWWILTFCFHKKEPTAYSVLFLLLFK